LRERSISRREVVMATDAQSGIPGPIDSSPTSRELARKRLQAKREFTGNVAAYVVVNAFLIVIWALSGAGYFWPGWVLAGWGIGLLLHGWDVYFRRPITEADVEAEMRRSGLG
jgi:hypothetical protein